MDMETTAPTAAAAMATVVIERKYQPRMMVSLCLSVSVFQFLSFSVSLQRIFLSA
jgi:hypothetical protein